MMPTPSARVVAVGLLLVGCLAACTGTPPTGSPSVPQPAEPSASTPPNAAPAAASSAAPDSAPVPGSSAAAAPYAHTGANDLTGPALTARHLVYVPSQLADTVQVIDPATYTVVSRFRVGRSPEHVVPSHDLSTLWVNSDAGDSMTPIDPATGQPKTAVAVTDPYNLYFTPDGRYALVMAERLQAIVVRDATTMALVRTLPLPCRGINHADFSADLTTLVASCEFSGQLIVVDADATHLVKVVDLNGIATPGATSPAMAHQMGGPRMNLAAGASAMPQDVRLSPDGRWFLAADMLRNGVWVIDAHTLEYSRFVPTGTGAHGIYPSRDATAMYVSNRDAGTVSVLDAHTLDQTALWTVPGGGSPDMGGVTVDGTELWLSGRYNSVVYVFDTRTGQVTHRIPVDAGPHGLLVWPQPGRISLGHTGNMR